MMCSLSDFHDILGMDTDPMFHSRCKLVGSLQMFLDIPTLDLGHNLFFD